MTDSGCPQQKNGTCEQSLAVCGGLSACSQSTQHEVRYDENSMPRFGNQKHDWLNTVAVLATGAGFLLAAYLLAGLTGFLN